MSCFLLQNPKLPCEYRSASSVLQNKVERAGTWTRACPVSKEIAPAVSLHYVQSTLQANATDTKHTTIVKNRNRDGCVGPPHRSLEGSQAEIWSPSSEGG